MQAEIHGVKFTDNDIVNVDDYAYSVYSEDDRLKMFILHDCGFCLGVVFADNLDDALDIAADKGKLDSYAVEREDEDRGDIIYAGNDCTPYDIEGVDYIQLPAPKFSVCTLLTATQGVVQ